MVNLIMKDIIIQKKALLYALVYGIAILLIFSLGGGDLAAGAYIMGSVGVTYLFVQMGCANDDKNKTEMIFNSLPIRREEFVAAKYISSVLFTFLTILMFVIAGYLLAGILPGKIPVITLGDIRIALSSSWLFISLYLPIYFWLGYIKAKIYNLIIFFPFFFGPSLIRSLITDYPAHQVSQTALDLLTNHGKSSLEILILVVVGVSLWISMSISTHVYKKKEL